jgi:hypothetical protein
MLFQIKVIFKQDRMPSPEQILERVRQITGLLDIEMIKDDPHRFRHPDFPKMLFVFFPDEGGYTVWTGEQNMTYMEGVTVAALVDLGGIYEYTLRDWSRKSWEEVRHLF